MGVTTPAERQRAYRERQGAGTRRGPAPSAPCGSVSAYKRHRRNGEDIDPACASAWAEYQRERYAARKDRR